jgi:Domain of unknown function (DUF4357)
VSLGVSLRIFLPDGTPDGVRLVSKSNWTGRAIAASRSRYPVARSSRPEFRTPGVYVLVGPPENAKFEARIYVGEGEEPKARIDSHHAEKDFWNRLILFTTVGQVLNKAAIRYLEARLLALATAAGRAELDNGTGSGLPALEEADQQDAESFLHDMLIIYPLLGLNVFEPLEQPAQAETLSLSGPNAEARGVETEDGFLVFTGAKARSATVESTPSWAVSLRKELVDSGALVPEESGVSLKLVVDHEFKSPSAAAAVLLGRSAAGPLEWKNASGTPLRRLREEAVADSADSQPLAAGT